MSKNTAYFEKRPDIVKIFQDLEDFRNYCRDAFCKFDEADLYKRTSYEWRQYLASKKRKTQNRKK